MTANGVLVLAATPIGDVRDAAPRLLRELATADLVAAEDTRRLHRLCAELEVTVSGRTLSYHEHNEASRTPDLLARLVAGDRVLLVTDAGMPSVSDPGFRLVSAAAAAGIRVTCVPGPSAVLMALVVSALPVDRFCFEGFPARRPGDRARQLADLASERRTMVFFEAPHRLAATLTAMGEAFGTDRRAAVCRELTKTYEEVRRGTVGELAAWAQEGVRGEVTLVVGGAAPPPSDPAEGLRQVQALVAAGARLKDASAEVSERTGLSRKSLYDAAVVARGARREGPGHGSAAPG